MHGGAELKFSTTAHEAGLYHSLVIAGRGARKTFHLPEEGISALSAAVEAIEQKPERISEFPITSELSLVCEPKRLALVNCEAKFEFASFQKLRSLWERIHERALIEQLFN